MPWKSPFVASGRIARLGLPPCWRSRLVLGAVPTLDARKSLTRGRRESQKDFRLRAEPMQLFSDLARFDVAPLINNRNFGCLRVAVLGDVHANKEGVTEIQSSGRQEADKAV